MLNTTIYSEAVPAAVQDTERIMPNLAARVREPKSSQIAAPQL